MAALDCNDAPPASVPIKWRCGPPGGCQRRGGGGRLSEVATSAAVACPRVAGTPAAHSAGQPPPAAAPRLPIVPAHPLTCSALRRALKDPGLGISHGRVTRRVQPPPSARAPGPHERARSPQRSPLPPPGQPPGRARRERSIRAVSAAQARGRSSGATAGRNTVAAACLAAALASLSASCIANESMNPCRRMRSRND